MSQTSEHPTTTRRSAKRRGAKLLVSFAAALSLMSGVFATQAPPAHAWSQGNVWVNFGPGNCPAGRIVAIYWVIDGNSTGPAGGDWGDNVIYPRARVGVGSFNTLSYQIKCKYGWFVYNGMAGQRSFSASRSGQSFTF